VGVEVPRYARDDKWGLGGRRWVLRSLAALGMTIWGRDDKRGRRVGCGAVGVEVPRYARDDKMGVGCAVIRVEVPPRLRRVRDDKMGTEGLERDGRC